MVNGELLLQIPLFEAMGKGARDFITKRLRKEDFYSGEVIVRQGDTGDSLYIITSGLVKVTKREKDGTSQELARLQAGDYFGEMSLLGGQPRSADITAIGETSTVVLFKEDMDAILRDYPSIAVHFSKVLSKRLRDTSQLQLAAKQQITLISLYSRYVEPELQSVLAINFAASLTRELMKRVLFIDMSSHNQDVLTHLKLEPERERLRQYFSQQEPLHESDVSPCIIQHKSGFHILPLSIGIRMQPRLLEKKIAPLLEKFHKEYDYILVNCSKEIKLIVQNALEQSDLILYLTPSSENAIQRCKKDADMFMQGYGENQHMLIAIMQEERPLFSGRLLEEILAPHPFVSIHKNDYILEHFLRTGRPFVYEHPKSNVARSIQQIARRIGKVRVGLALGSGAARGFAHAGILKILEENDIPIDMISGSSMGAFVGGFYAAGVSASELEEMVLSYKNRRKVRRTIFDITIPLYGFSKGNRLAKFMRNSLGDKTFDELDIPFIAVATDISNGSEVVLRHGIVWQALRASGSVPVLFEPYELDGRFLIDGGITNPLPTDILIEQNIDIIISCTVNSVKAPIKHLAKEDAETNRHFALPVSGRKYSILDAITRSMGIMSAANTLQKTRLADVDIHPDVSYIDWTDFHRGKDLLHEGQRAAEDALPTILAFLEEKRR